MFSVNERLTKWFNMEDLISKLSFEDFGSIENSKFCDLFEKIKGYCPRKSDIEMTKFVSFCIYGTAAFILK